MFWFRSINDYEFLDITKPKSNVQSVKSLPNTLNLDRNVIKLSRSLLVVYIAGKAFADLSDVSISFLLPSHGSHLGLDDLMVSLSSCMVPCELVDVFCLFYLFTKITLLLKLGCNVLFDSIMVQN